MTGSENQADSGPPSGERNHSPRRQEIVVATFSMSQPVINDWGRPLEIGRNRPTAQPSVYGVKENGKRNHYSCN